MAFVLLPSGKISVVPCRRRWMRHVSSSCLTMIFVLLPSTRGSKRSARPNERRADIYHRRSQHHTEKQLIRLGASTWHEFLRTRDHSFNKLWCGTLWNVMLKGKRRKPDHASCDCTPLRIMPCLEKILNEFLSMCLSTDQSSILCNFGPVLRGNNLKSKN